MHRSPDFDVAVHQDDGVLVVAPVGEIDLATVDQVRAAFAQHAGGPVVLDLRGVQFLDSSGLRVVLEQVQRAAEQGFPLRVVRGPEDVQRLFEMTGIIDRLTFVDDPADIVTDGSADSG